MADEATTFRFVLVDETAAEPTAAPASAASSFAPPTPAPGSSVASTPPVASGGAGADVVSSSPAPPAPSAPSPTPTTSGPPAAPPSLTTDGRPGSATPLPPPTGQQTQGGAATNSTAPTLPDLRWLNPVPVVIVGKFPLPVASAGEVVPGTLPAGGGDGGAAASGAAGGGAPVVVEPPDQVRAKAAATKPAVPGPGQGIPQSAGGAGGEPSGLPAGGGAPRAGGVKDLVRDMLDKTSTEDAGKSIGEAFKSWLDRVMGNVPATAEPPRGKDDEQYDITEAERAAPKPVDMDRPSTPEELAEFKRAAREVTPAAPKPRDSEIDVLEEAGAPSAEEKRQRDMAEARASEFERVPVEPVMTAAPVPGGKIDASVPEAKPITEAVPEAPYAITEEATKAEVATSRDRELAMAEARASEFERVPVPAEPVQMAAPVPGGKIDASMLEAKAMPAEDVKEAPYAITEEAKEEAETVATKPEAETVATKPEAETVAEAAKSPEAEAVATKPEAETVAEAAKSPEAEAVVEAIGTLTERLSTLVDVLGRDVEAQEKGEREREKEKEVEAAEGGVPPSLADEKVEAAAAPPVTAEEKAAEPGRPSAKPPEIPVEAEPEPIGATGGGFRADVRTPGFEHPGGGGGKSWNLGDIKKVMGEGGEAGEATGGAAKGAGGAAKAAGGAAKGATGAAEGATGAAEGAAAGGAEVAELAGAAAAGPAAPIVLAAEEAKKMVIGAIDFAGDAMTKLGQVSVQLAGNDNFGALANVSHTVADGLKNFGDEGEIAGHAIEAITVGAEAFNAVVDAFVGRELARYDVGLSTAGAMADVRSLLEDIKEAQDLSEPLSRLTEALSQASAEFREMLLPVKKWIIEVLAPIMERIAEMLHDFNEGKSRLSVEIIGGLKIMGDMALGPMGMLMIPGHLTEMLDKLKAIDENTKKEKDSKTGILFEKQLEELLHQVPVVLPAPLRPDEGLADISPFQPAGF